MRAVIWLILLIGTASAISDCELCAGPITAIYGVCSPELVLNYMNKTGMKEPIEWICLINSPMTGENSTNEKPAYAIVMANRTLTLYTIYGAVKIYPPKEINKWGWKYDYISEDFFFWIEYNATRFPSIKSFKVMTPITLSRNSTAFENKNVSFKFSPGTPISDVSLIPGGFRVDLSLASTTGKYNVSGTMGKLDACAITCLREGDDVVVENICNSCLNVPVGSTFGGDGARWVDLEDSCSVVGCVFNYNYNGDGGVWATIPTSNGTKNIDCNGVACKSITNPTKNTWYYKTPKCRNVGSAYVKNIFSGTGYESPELVYSCISGNTAPGIFLTAPANNSNLTNPPPVNFTFYFIDPQNSSANCSLWINGTLWLNNASTLNNTNTSFQVSFNYSAVNMSWFINCSDGLLSNVSQTWYFSVHPSGPGWGLGLSLIPLILLILAGSSKSLPMQFVLITSALLAIIAFMGLNHVSGYLDPATAMVLQYIFILLWGGLAMWFIGPIIYQGIKNYGQR